YTSKYSSYSRSATARDPCLRGDSHPDLGHRGGRNDDAAVLLGVEVAPGRTVGFEVGSSPERLT
ncbi:MAG TPA: hypothetical protein VIV12_25110, partial [Streptosporangiaceae bacterium]